MVDGDVTHFLPQIAVMPTHRDLYGSDARLEDLVGIVKKYRATEWLSYLSRIHHLLATDETLTTERIQRVIGGTVPHPVRQRLEKFKRSLKPGQKVALYYERQISTLQQLVVLHAPETGTSKLDCDEGRQDLTLALLMTADIMIGDRLESGGVESLLAITVQDQIRMSTTPAWVYATRAFYFYEMNRSEQSEDVVEYLKLFQIATEVSAVDWILGGLTITIQEESRSLDEIANAWHALPLSRRDKNPKEADVLGAYAAVRMKSLSDLRALIKKREGNRPIRDWNLIALSESPIVDFGDRGAFVLSHTALARSLFDSVRHAILTAALAKKLPEPYTNKQAIGRLYGSVFESYVRSLFESAYPDQVLRVPEDKHEKRADFLIWFPDKVIVVEVKGTHFVGVNHASFLSIEERQKELEKIGLRKAVDQLEATIRALRRGEIGGSPMPPYDWTVTPIVPLIVTEERMPQVPGCWETFYGPLCAPLKKLSAAGRMGRLRLMTVGSVERLPDAKMPEDLPTMLLQWGADRSVMELNWSRFLETRNVSFENTFVRRRFFETVKLLAQRLGLDAEKLAIPPDEKTNGRPSPPTSSIGEAEHQAY